VLERIPEDRLSWRPHPTSMSLGQLALHVAATPAGVAMLVQQDSMEAPKFEQAEATSRTEVISTFQQSADAMRTLLNQKDDAWMMSPWTLTNQGRSVMQAPRAAVVRMVGMNHVYHHRGQLAMCLRMLGVPVPSVYGPSRDDNPFA
jgi:uncharacterized damage-inducible protein DinB